jgi:GNAT superfamily N-acetyltransferase
MVASRPSPAVNSPGSDSESVPEATGLSPALRVRLARPDEFDKIVAIDDDASALFTERGLAMGHLHPGHPFVVREQMRWRAAIAARTLWVICAPHSEEAPVAFASLGVLDGAAHLDQLSVQRGWMRRGMGRTLVAHALQWSEGRGALWLTTYDHLPWNRSYYERLGFSVVKEAECGPDLREILREEREALPVPEARVAMRIRV